MNERYDFASIESKWQTKWSDEKTYKVTEDKSKPKYYCLLQRWYNSNKECKVQ